MKAFFPWQEKSEFRKRNNMNTCQLKLNDPGLNEFGMPMCMIMALQESYTGGTCYMMENGNPHEYMPAYLRILQDLFDRRFRLPGRCKLWDMLLFFKKNEKLETLTGEKLIENYWDSYGKLNSAQFRVVVSIMLQETKEIPVGFEMEKYLVDILVELKEIWRCRYVDKEFVEEFINHKDEKPYKKAIVLFKNILDEETEYFPELTKWQAKEWVITRYRDKSDKIRMSAYQSLMMNRDKRTELFGF